MYIPYMDGMGCIYAQVPTNKRSHTHKAVFSAWNDLLSLYWHCKDEYDLISSSFSY